MNPLAEIRQRRAAGFLLGEDYDWLFAEVMRLRAELEFSRQTTTNVMEALAANGAETVAAEAEVERLRGMEATSAKLCATALRHAQRAEAERDRYRTAWKSAATRAGIAADEIARLLDDRECGRCSECQRGQTCTGIER